MAVPQGKEALLQAIDASFGKLLTELAAVPANEVAAASMEGHAKGTRMSVADLVAYLLGWNELVLKWLELDAAGAPIPFPEAGFRWNELGRLAQKFYADHQDVPYPQLVDRLVAAKDRIVLAIRARSDDDLYGRPWYGKWTMGRMIQLNTSSPYANARGRLRKRRKAPA
ncbi:ClbS/DfsB family four-helix bundle protein [Frigidibacter mobilis]|uniref:ClbS/DfsB family four-helix bundle protein n=1 Tax=Frigidibacter mobilis TaxID=1335048 RepID=A0A159Z1Z4_9RHOB|nr:ClbS/DfsB family four-helix bundle protein [Frigidibacter mobilis]AMY68000.1 hypothetical protein AKL17_0741 [Frigidibacter mobilis]